MEYSLQGEERGCGMAMNETSPDSMMVEAHATRKPAQVCRLMGLHARVRVIDVRSGMDYDMGHIQGAVSMPREAWDHNEFLGKDDLNIIYGSSAEAEATHEAAEQFAKKGYRVIVLEGGFEAWLASGLPLAAR
jgi:rhodanese-related sulfurtransferase